MRSGSIHGFAAYWIISLTCLLLFLCFILLCLFFFSNNYSSRSSLTRGLPRLGSSLELGGGGGSCGCGTAQSSEEAEELIVPVEGQCGVRPSAVFDGLFGDDLFPCHWQMSALQMLIAVFFTLWLHLETVSLVYCQKIDHWLRHWGFSHLILEKSAFRTCPGEEHIGFVCPQLSFTGFAFVL